MSVAGKHVRGGGTGSGRGIALALRPVCVLIQAAGEVGVSGKQEADAGKDRVPVLRLDIHAGVLHLQMVFAVGAPMSVA